MSADHPAPRREKEGRPVGEIHVDQVGGRSAPPPPLFGRMSDIYDTGLRYVVQRAKAMNDRRRRGDYGSTDAASRSTISDRVALLSLLAGWPGHPFGSYISSVDVAIDSLDDDRGIEECSSAEGVAARLALFTGTGVADLVGYAPGYGFQSKLYHYLNDFHDLGAESCRLTTLGLVTAEGDTMCVRVVGPEEHVDAVVAAIARATMTDDQVRRKREQWERFLAEQNDPARRLGGV